MSDTAVLIVCVAVLAAITLHWYRPFREDSGKKLVPDAIDGPGDILPHLYAAGLREAQLQFKKDALGWWLAEITVGVRRFQLSYHHGELGCSEVGGTDIALPRGAYSVCTVSQRVAMLCFEIGSKVK